MSQQSQHLDLKCCALQQYFHIASQLRVCSTDCKLPIFKYSRQLFENLTYRILDGNDLLKMHADCNPSGHRRFTSATIFHFQKDGLSCAQVFPRSHEHRKALTVLREQVFVGSVGALADGRCMRQALSDPKRILQAMPTF